MEEKFQLPVSRQCGYTFLLPLKYLARKRLKREPRRMNVANLTMCQ